MTHIHPLSERLSSSSARSADARLVWQLLSPCRRRVTCEVRRVGGGFELAVVTGDEIFVTNTGATLEELHETAARWRVALESKGYVPAGQVYGTEPTANERDSEARAALRGVIESAKELAGEAPASAAALRDHATVGLVALGLSDYRMALEAAASARAILRNLSGLQRSSSVIANCEILLSRLEIALPPVETEPNY